MITKCLKDLDKARLNRLSKEEEYRRSEAIIAEEAKRGDWPAELVNEYWIL